jgi:hypothetical protein
MENNCISSRFVRVIRGNGKKSLMSVDYSGALSRKEAAAQQQLAVFNFKSEALLSSSHLHMFHS